MSPTPTHWRRADAETEEALGEDREEDEAAGDDGLDERQRRERQGRDVEAPRAGGDEHAEREPLRAVEGDRAGNRMAPLDGGRSSMAPLCFHRKPKFVAKRAEERQQDAKFDSHGKVKATD